MSTWYPIICALTVGVLAGGLLWALLRLLLAIAQRWPAPKPFAADILNPPDACAARSVRAARDALLALAVAPLVAGIAAALWYLAQPPAWQGVWQYGLFAAAALLAIVWGVYLWRGIRALRAAQFTARAQTALGHVLQRLALKGQRVFHAVNLGKEAADHVVVGSRGVFVIQVVARPEQAKADAVRLHKRQLQFQDGVSNRVIASQAERAARQLGELCSRKLGHKINVRAVIAIPGWRIVQGDDAELLVVNEKNIVMLPSMARPADHLMDEDALAIHEALIAITRGK